MAWKLLHQIMHSGKPKRSQRRCVLFLCSLFALGLASHKAVGQTGSVTAQTTNVQFAAAESTTGPEPAFQLKGQSHLEKHIQRIIHFRALLEQDQGQQASLQTDVQAGRHRPTLRDSIIPKSQPAVRSDAKDLAILELEMSISAKDGPSTIYPGVGLVMAIQQIGNLSKKHMIDALRRGGKPIYSNIGHLIGVEDPTSGRLLGGRRS